MSQELKREVVSTLLKTYSVQKLNQNLKTWIVFKTVAIEEQEIEFDKHYYSTVDQDSTYLLKNASLTIKYYVSQELQSKKNPENNIFIKARWSDNSKFVREVRSTLCPDQICIPSFFTLEYFLRTKKIYIDTNRIDSLLKYDFDTERHIPLTDKDAEALNCLLKNEIDDEKSFLWNFRGIKRVGEIKEVEEVEVDSVSGASKVADVSQGSCPIPEGALWTTLTVFAHAYEMKHKIERMPLYTIFQAQENHFSDE
ncbi:MAG: hypothetical protein KDD52_06990 [Bdellovibrionales bacterium]|nr:hypothetical protein [Bdellovibrionales bacterium]